MTTESWFIVFINRFECHQVNITLKWATVASLQNSNLPNIHNHMSISFDATQTFMLNKRR
jgi:hypothetical protein